MLREYVTKRRKEMKMSQEELAKRIGVRRSTISDFENGKSSLGSEKIEEIMRIMSFKIYQSSEAYSLALWEKAQDTAKLLKDKPKEEISNMSRDEMYELTNDDLLLTLKDVKDEHNNYLVDHKQIEEKETYNYFLTLVLFHHALKQGKKEDKNKIS